MFTKHTTVGKYKFISSQTLFLPERFNQTKKEMKDHEIYLRYTRDPKSVKIIRYVSFSIAFRRARGKIACMHLDHCIVVSGGFQFNSISKYSGFDVNSIVAFGFVQFPAWIRINVLTANLLK